MHGCIKRTWCVATVRRSPPLRPGWRPAEPPRAGGGGRPEVAQFTHVHVIPALGIALIPLPSGPSSNLLSPAVSLPSSTASTRRIVQRRPSRPKGYPRPSTPSAHPWGPPQEPLERGFTAAAPGTPPPPGAHHIWCGPKPNPGHSGSHTSPNRPSRRRAPAA